MCFINLLPDLVGWLMASRILSITDVVDRAFIEAVMRYSAVVGSKAFPIGIYTWPLTPSEFKTFSDATAHAPPEPRVSVAGPSAGPALAIEDV